MEYNTILKAVGKDEKYFTEEGVEYIKRLAEVSNMLKVVLSQEQLSLLVDAIDSPTSALWLSDLITYKG